MSVSRLFWQSSVVSAGFLDMSNFPKLLPLQFNVSSAVKNSMPASVDIFLLLTLRFWILATSDLNMDPVGFLTMALTAARKLGSVNLAVMSSSEGVGAGFCVAVGFGAAVCLGAGDGVRDGVAMGFGAGDGVRVAVGFGAGVGVRVAVGFCAGAGVGVRVAVGFGAAVCLGAGDGVRVCLGAGDGVRDGVAVALGAVAGA